MSSNTERCLGKLKGSIFPVQYSLFSLLPYGFIAQVFEVDCGRIGKIPPRRLFQGRFEKRRSRAFQSRICKFPISINQDHKCKPSRAIFYQQFIMMMP